MRLAVFVSICCLGIITPSLSANDNIEILEELVRELEEEKRGCIDVAPGVVCRSVAAKGFCGHVPGCRLTCGQCEKREVKVESVRELEEEKRDCENEWNDEECDELAAGGYCTKPDDYLDLLLDGCQRSCGQCEKREVREELVRELKKEKRDCEDWWGDECIKLAAEGYCTEPSRDLEDLLDGCQLSCRQCDKREVRSRAEMVTGTTQYNIGKRVVTQKTAGVVVSVPFRTDKGPEQLFHITSEPAGDNNCVNFVATAGRDNARCLITGVSGVVKVKAEGTEEGGAKGWASCVVCDGKIKTGKTCTGVAC